MPIEGKDFEALFAAEYASVVRTVYLIVRDRGHAEELTQDSFARLLIHWSRVRHYDRPDAWVRRVAVRLALRHRSREWARPEVEARARVDRVASLPPDVDLFDAVAGLPRRERAVVVLFYYEDLPMKEIARILRVPESTGFVLLHRARKRLALVLGDEAVADGP